MNESPEGAPPGAGKSSVHLLDVPRLFDALRVSEVTAVLDAGCGRGAFALPLAQRLPPGGRVWAVDLWGESVSALRHQADERGLDNVMPLVADLGRGLPLGDRSVDLCLMATVLHDLVLSGIAESALREVARVVRIGGTLAVVEFKMVAGPPGPPLRVRLSEHQVQALVRPRGFATEHTVDLGPYHYLALLRRRAS